MKLLSYDDLKIVKGIPFSRPWIWRLEKQGRFPRRRSIGEKTVAWVEDEIDAWVKERIQAPPSPPCVPAKRGTRNAGARG